MKERGRLTIEVLVSITGAASALRRGIERIKYFENIFLPFP